ncbi:MAG: SEC-C metal-binding domain-containing protein [Bacteroidaceae bacterium]|nr:SEC-C metal-binding domain-containing protein [Bacteroidaceae bacterium]
MPSNHNTDYVFEAQQMNKYQKIHAEWIKHGNNRCPCGSGKPWIQCHGK